MKANCPGNLGKHAVAKMQIASILEPKMERGTWKNTRMNLNLFKYTLPHRVRPRANYGPPEVEHLHVSRHNASADFCFVCFD